jgi:hypothetical protein
MSKRRTRNWIQPVVTLVCLIGASLPTGGPVLANFAHERKVSSQEYTAQYGHWEVIELPEAFRTNAIHAALLPTGNVLLVAGSGNDQPTFDAYKAGDISVLETVVLNPDTLEARLVETPEDFFCAGHAHLPQGDLLVAGGTNGYEVLEDNVTKPAGPMTIRNEDPDDVIRVIEAGTRFISKRTGKAYVSVEEVTVLPANKIDHGRGRVEITASSQTVFVEAVEAAESYQTEENEQFTIDGLKGEDAQNIYGQGGPMMLEKQDFRGISSSYQFNPWTEQYEQVGSMEFARWYPTLVQLPPAESDGGILAVSGLDNTGRILQGQNEVYNPQTQTWSTGPEQYFPTYPALTLTADGTLFYSGSSTGYGAQDKGRDPGIWNTQTNTFNRVGGLRDPEMMETSATVLLPPNKGQNEQQSQRIMVLGGGEIGEGYGSSRRTDIIDLSKDKPRFRPGPDLAERTRYPIVVTLPNDEVLVTGGSQGYRGRSNSDHHVTQLYDPTANVFRDAADQIVGRNYHSGGILLPDGRVLVFGGDPLFADEANTQEGEFEQRLEIFTPPYLFQGKRPQLDSGPGEVNYGSTVTFNTRDADTIVTARLIPPSSTTHATNVEQRSIAVPITHQPGAVDLEIPDNPNLLPPGWYMLFVTNADNTPSVAEWVYVE